MKKMNLSLAAAMLLSLVGSSPSAYAFVPQPSSFVPSRACHSSTKNTKLVPSPSIHPSVARQGSVSMGMTNGLIKAHKMFVYAARPDLALFDGMVQAAKTSMENVANSIESQTPEKELNKCLVDMQDDLLKIKKAYAETMDRQRRMLHQKRQIEAVSDSWYRRAMYALRLGYERNARDALLQRQPYVAAAENLQVRIDAQAAAMDRLYAGAQLLESEFREAVAKKSDLVTRAKTARSVKEVNEMLSGLTGKRSIDAFHKLEEKVEAMEAEAEASSKEIVGKSVLTDDAAGLEMKFKVLEGEEEMERELKKLKEKRNTSDPISAVPFSSLKSDSEIVHELEELGRKLLESGRL
eukprot:CAMPEP_0197435684 /NCGR_PEP_ID=MMETSP1175-20131217/3246_1 /TAXON_ID=1003142 /ORGANISM="Triceratium dubium, Strain CCMP147" /LENGTH=351 /DNA_ID=CAMNT_0042964787 /DNA_START=88 /DNA_END=1143 /DNA_ORIENTATION=-